ncbi:centrosomal protein of 120 kDa [Sabethes cyaneus]|uniref:centrosomal protein of 120 kDa n=1 Tax=Sabethes cyaneus TaxID=53552 RepID=UPI00237EB2A0|nr:centrosomal protein of 120 kDa [Sabethes cyaneus]
MEQSEDQLIIVLHVLEAINLHRAKNTPIIITASLDKNTLQTDSRLPGIASTNFDSNLIWETDRRSVRRMKTENLPIKLECYSIEQSADQQRSLIGHLVLPLRSIPLLPSIKADTIKPRWYRLIGLASPEWKNQRPEVQLIVLITDKGYLLPESKKIPIEVEQETDRCLVIFANPQTSRLQSREGLPIRLLEERGLLQVGHEEQESDIFLVKIVLKYAKQLAALLSDEERQAESLSSNGIQMRYDLLGDSYPCNMERKPNGTFLIQEKIVLNFRTTLHSLKRYFAEIFTLRLEILLAKRVIGRCTLRFDDIVEDEPLTTFLSKYEHTFGTQEVEKYHPIEPASIKYQEASEGPSDRSSLVWPAIKCKFSLKYLSSDKKIIHKTDGKIHCISEPEKHIDLAPTEPFGIQDVPVVPSIDLNPVVSCAAMSTKIDIQSILHCEDRDLRDIPRTCAYHLFVQSVRFNARPSGGLWQLSLYHPKADTPLTKVTLELNTIESNTLDFPNLQLQLYFSALPDRVLEPITSDCSKLTLSGPHGLFCFARVDNQSLVIGSKEKRAGVLILESTNGENVGMATVCCHLDEVGINFNSHEPVAGPEVAAMTKGEMDDQLSYKMLEEQKQWILEQRELFLLELKRKETAHLAKLTNEWKKRRAKDSSDLAKQLEHVAALTTALEESRKSIALQSAQRIEQNKSTEEIKLKLEASFNQQLEEIREKTKRMEADLQHREQLRALRCQEMETRNDTLIRENEQLKETEQQLLLKVGTLSCEVECSGNLRQQVALLEQKLTEMEKSKLFYKQQWAKMVREMHKMKQQNGEQLDEVLRGRERRKKDLHWEHTGCSQRKADAADEDAELSKIHRMIFDERQRQQQYALCCRTDDCC